MNVRTKLKGYQVFMLEHRSRIMEHVTKASRRDNSRKVTHWKKTTSKLWNRLSEEEKEKYRKKGELWNKGGAPAHAKAL